MSMQRRRLLQSFGANGMAQGINLLIQLISVPMFLYFWGVERYGDWLLLSTLPTYLAMGDVGFINAAGNEMGMRAARGDRDGARAVFQGTLYLVLGITLAVGALGLLAAWGLPLHKLLDLSQTGHRETAVAATLFVAYVAVGWLGGVYFFAFRCDGRYPLAMLWGNVGTLLSFVALALAVIFSHSMIAAAGAWLAARIIILVGFVVMLRRISPWLRALMPSSRASFRELRPLAAPAIAFMGFPIGNALSVQGMVILIGRLLNPVAVVVFTTVRTLANVTQQALLLVNQTVGPEMSLAYGGGDLDFARRLHRRACQAAIWLAALASVALWFLGPTILQHWTRGRVPVDVALLRVMLGVMFIRALWYTSAVVAMAINRPQKLSIWYVVGSAASLLLAGPLIAVMDLTGAAVALLAVELLMLVYVIPSSLRLLEDRFADFARSMTTLPSFDFLKGLTPWKADRPAE